MTARRLAQRMHVTIVERATGGIAPYRIVVSELNRQRRTIVLYRDTLALLRELIVRERLPFDAHLLEDIAVAHECVHYRLPQIAEQQVHERAQRLLRLTNSPALLSGALVRYAAGAVR